METARRYTLDECYLALSVDPKTFRAWLKRDGISATPSKADARVKYLSEEQMRTLAELHERPWPPVEHQPEAVAPPASYKLLIEQLEGTARSVDRLRTDLHVLRTQELEPLRQEYEQRAEIAPKQEEQQQQIEQLSSRQDTLDHDLAEIQAQIQATRTALEVQGEQVQAGQRALESLQGEIQTALKEHAEQIQQTQHAQGEIQATLKAQQEEMRTQFQADLQRIEGELRKQFQMDLEAQAEFQTVLQAQAAQAQEKLQRIQNELQAAFQHALREQAKQAQADLQRHQQEQHKQFQADLQHAQEAMTKDFQTALQELRQEMQQLIVAQEHLTSLVETKASEPKIAALSQPQPMQSLQPEEKSVPALPPARKRGRPRKQAVE